MQIVITDAPDEAGRQGVITAIDTYNAQHADPAPARKLSVLLRDPSTDAVLGGMHGVTYWEWLSLRIVFLPGPARRQGLGRRMLQAMEQAALAQGCRGVLVHAYDFATPEFFLAQGYEAFASLDERHGHQRRWFRKHLRPEPVDLPPDTHVTGQATDADLATLRRTAEPPIDAHLAPPDRRPLGLLLRDPASGAHVGGMLASVEGNWLFIDLLALPEQARRSGLGSRLMALAEQETQARGLMGIWLDTFSFQARPFYERLGYRVFGEIDAYPAGHRRFFLAKEAVLF